MNYHIVCLVELQCAITTGIDNTYNFYYENTWLGSVCSHRTP